MDVSPFFGSAFFAGFQPLGTQGLATKLSNSILLMATRNPEFTRLILRIFPCFKDFIFLTGGQLPDFKVAVRG